jgi:hypothetical protein
MFVAEFHNLLVKLVMYTAVRTDCLLSSEGLLDMSVNRNTSAIRRGCSAGFTVAPVSLEFFPRRGLLMFTMHAEFSSTT